MSKHLKASAKVVEFKPDVEKVEQIELSVMYIGKSLVLEGTVAAMVSRDNKLLLRVLDNRFSTHEEFKELQKNPSMPIGMHKLRFYYEAFEDGKFDEILKDK